MRMILAEEAKQLSPTEKWDLLSPHLKHYGQGSLAYATLQQGMEYFVHPKGYLAFTTAVHPVFARKGKRIVLGDPVCAAADTEEVIRDFVRLNPHCVFVVISEQCATLVRTMGFKVNTVGYEPVLPVQSYNTQGNWKELDLIKRARNEAKREGIVIREVDIETVSPDALEELSRRWLDGKTVNDREIWVYARRPVYQPEPDVRKFAAFDKNGGLIGYAFYDPIYRDGRIIGYSANTVRCDEKKYGRLATAVHMAAMDVFRGEGVEEFNLLMCPFDKVEQGKYCDDWGTKFFFKTSVRYGNEIYNFKGLSFHKSKYRGQDKFVYFASNGKIPSNDVYLAFLTSDIADSYWVTMGRLLKGVVKETFLKRKAPPKAEGKAKVTDATAQAKPEGTVPQKSKPGPAESAKLS